MDKAKRGRPRIYETEQQRRAAIRERDKAKRRERGLKKRGAKPKYTSERERLDQANARRREARANDPTYRERANAYQKRYETRQGSAETERKRQWYRDNPLTSKVQRQRRRGRKQGASGWHTRAQIEAIKQCQGGHCAYCQETQGLHLDHIISLANGGSNWPWNLQWLCAYHNTSKGALNDGEYRAKVGLPDEMPISLIMWHIALGLF